MHALRLTGICTCLLLFLTLVSPTQLFFCSGKVWCVTGEGGQLLNWFCNLCVIDSSIAVLNCKGIGLEAKRVLRFV